MPSISKLAVSCWQGLTVIQHKAGFMAVVGSWMLLQKWCVNEILFSDKSFLVDIGHDEILFSQSKESWSYILVFDNDFPRNCHWNLYFCVLKHLAFLHCVFINPVREVTHNCSPLSTNWFPSTWGTQRRGRSENKLRMHWNHQQMK